MPKGSGQANRNIGLDHANGKGDKTRVTDVKAYRANFDEINWQLAPTFKSVIKLAKKISEELLREDGPRLKTLREIEDEEFAWRHGL